MRATGRRGEIPELRISDFRQCFAWPSRYGQIHYRSMINTEDILNIHDSKNRHSLEGGGFGRALEHMV